MAYRFKLDETFTDGVRRIGADQLRHAQSELAAGPTVTAVHETRKSIKRLRAVLRLVRPGIGAAVFDRENARLRDIARLLAGDRDRTVLIATFDRLATQQDDHGRKLLERLRPALQSAHAQGKANGIDPLGDAAIRLEKAERAWGRLAVEADGFETIGDGLARAYQHCSDACEAACTRHRSEAASDRAFHDWRKTVQQHWRHMRLLSHGWPEYFDARAKAARELSEILGAAQDLAVFATTIEPLATQNLSRKDAARVVALVRARQHDLHDQARPLGERMLAEGTSGFVRRVGIYWSTASAIPSRSDVDTTAEPDRAAAPAPLRKAAPKAPARRARKATIDRQAVKPQR